MAARKALSAREVLELLSRDDSGSDVELESSSSFDSGKADITRMEVDDSDADDREEAVNKKTSPKKENKKVPVKNLDSDVETEPCASQGSSTGREAKRRVNRSFMGAQKKNSDDGDSEGSEEWPTMNVRKSLKGDFDALSQSSQTAEPETDRTPRKEAPPADGDSMAEENNEVADADATFLNQSQQSDADAMVDYDVSQRDVYMSQEQAVAVLEDLPDPWRKQKEALMKMHRKLFTEWHFSLRMDMNILIHGVGSKKDLLEEFRMAEFSAEPCLVVDGFDKDCTIESVLRNFCELVIKPDILPKDFVGLLAIVRDFISENYSHFNIVLHNIDGMGLRNSAAQKLLSELADIPHVHLIASIDHPNLPLLWSQTELNRFNWVYYHTSTFAHYKEFPIPNLIVTDGKGFTASLSSLQQVFESLTVNARNIYRAIAKYQVNPTSEDEIVDLDLGMPYKSLYRISRSEFWVSSDSGLRKQLVEFYDHDLLKKKRGSNGQEYLRIPLSTDALKKFLTTANG